ncbi:hypothetical protein U8607_19820 [Methylobacterium durans]|jgi:hypothetical protein|uniref:Lectin-like protein BA14k n=1 Tax=Methylobacterium durans TaxID=2202825 RepID=A0A2U8WBW5_9HYPH|nr:hypothetical protein [Methylobacterium durans]AWN43091.1 hypothetical protein DK389_24615 [Methylobacterium durans]MEA1834347.1 hypothetical protein [Methylobacterium durans]
MKMLWATAAVGLGLLAAVGSPSAQPYGGPDYGYRDRDYRDRGRDYDDRGPRYRDRGAYGFDEREYLRCNPDVRRAVARGQMESGATHYRVFGRREGRRLSC